jgi:CubicO group peptidase (beta-lactamase class C family)
MRFAFLLAGAAALWTTGAIAFDPSPLAGLPAAIAKGDYARTTSVVVAQNGKVVFEQYFGEGSPEKLNNTRSATKIFAAIALGLAIRDGAVPSEQARAFAYFSDLKPFRNDTPDKEDVRLLDMLTMSSALDCDDSDDNSAGNEDKLHEQQNWTRWAVDLSIMHGYARDASGFGPWRYCTVNAFLVGQAVQRAVHTSVDQYVDEKVMKPLGIAQRSWSYSPSHETMTGGGLELRSRDWTKIAIMLADGGMWEGKQILPRTWVKAMFTVRRASRPDQNYGYFAFEANYKTPCGPRPVWFVAGNGRQPDPVSAGYPCRRCCDARKLQRPRIELPDAGVAGEIRAAFAALQIASAEKPGHERLCGREKPSRR